MKKNEFVKKVFRDIFLSVLSPFVKIEKSLIFIPHENCETDDYDIFSFSSDNVLALLNEILNDNLFDNYILYIVYYNRDKIDLYRKYTDNLERKAPVIWIHKDEKYSLLKATLKCKVCLTDHIHYDLQYKKKKQVFISLGYFTPFKNDYYVIRKLPKLMKKLRCNKVNKSFDYYIVTSEISGRITSIDTLLDYSKFKVLGYPRNDVFYRDVTSMRAKISNFLGNPRNIICYTPTFRDYERPDLYFYDGTKSKNKTLLGAFTEEQNTKLCELLDKTETVIIAKLHPLQELSVIKGNNNNRIVSFNEIRKVGLSLYDIMAVSDGLITDYTSTAFDYMHHEKPIIYYFYDYKEYESTRGFSFNPITSVCGGKVVYSAEELLVSLNELVSSNYCEDKKRQLIHDIINFHHDGSSGYRIKEFVKNCLE